MLRAFSDWLTDHSQSFATAARENIEAYIVACQAQGLAQATRARRLSAIRQLYRFAKEEGWREDNPAIRITGPGATRHLPQTLSEAEVTQIITAARSFGKSARDHSRNLALVELLYATGMRVSELVELPVAAVMVTRA